MSNILGEGQPRIGWMIDGNPETPHVATLLQRHGDRITLTVPWPPGLEASPYERWFPGFGDAQDEVPEVLLFEDIDGPVTLVGCRVRSSNRQMIQRNGQGVLDVEFAVLGARGPWAKIGGLRSELPGLGGWVQAASVRESRVEDSRHRLKALDYHLESPKPISLDRGLNLRLVPHFSSSAGARADVTELRQTVFVETNVTRPRPWRDHLIAHNAVRDLLSLATWRRSGYVDQSATHPADPHRTLDGTAHGTKWCSVESTLNLRFRPYVGRSDYLFYFEQVGAAGFRRWLRFRSSFRRGIDPLISLLALQGHTLETEIAQSGIGFESLGFELAREAGVARQAAGREDHRARLQRVFDQLPPEAKAKLEGWPERSARAYNGVKHADRRMPEVLELANTERQNVTVFRVWVATRIGVPESVLLGQAERARMFDQFTMD